MASAPVIGVLLLAFVTVLGHYTITIPKQWTRGEVAKVCVTISDPDAPPGWVSLRLSSRVDIPPWNFTLPPGITSTCNDLALSSLTHISRGYLWVAGTAAGKRLEHVAPISVITIERTFIHTEKELYLPTEVVRFRIFSITGTRLRMSFDPYPEVWVTAPSKVRIAQWLDVDNTLGIVHMEFQLNKHLHEGNYTVSVRNARGNVAQQHFRIKKYVDNLFGVKVIAPEKVNIYDDKINLTVCATYRFGQPVKGVLQLQVMNDDECTGSVFRQISIVGCMGVDIPTAELEMDYATNVLTVYALVTEEGTGVMLEAEDHVAVCWNSIAFETLYADQYMKPNLPFTIELRTIFLDGSVAPYVPVQACTEIYCVNMLSSGSGRVTLIVTEYSSKVITVKAKDPKSPHGRVVHRIKIEHYISPSGSSILIQAPEKIPECSGNMRELILPVLFADSNLAEFTLYVKVMSRGHVQWAKALPFNLSGLKKIPSMSGHLLPDYTRTKGIRTGVLQVPLSLPASSSSSIHVLMWYVRDDGEVVSDSKEIEMEKCLENPVELKWSSLMAEPEEEVAWSITALPFSVCSLGVVDRSLMLTNAGSNRMTIEDIFSVLNPLKPLPGARLQDWCPGTGCISAFQVFEDAGFTVFTDVDLQPALCGSHKPHEWELPDIEVQESVTFPHNWLWELVIIPASGTATKVQRMPEIITQWASQAVCVHPEQGMGLSKVVNITTFTPFFMDMNLPPYISEGEILNVDLSVFNYHQYNLTVNIAVCQSHQYEILHGLTDLEAAGETRAFVQVQDKYVFPVRIHILNTGEVNITAEAYVEFIYSNHINLIRRHTQSKEVTVEPEGYPRDMTWTKYICLTGQSSLPKETMTVTAPEYVIPESEYAWITVVGDIIRLTLKDLSLMIKRPYGNGEENILNFAQNVFILQYLQVTNQRTTGVVEKLLSYISDGYENELLFRHDDGSFSSLGNIESSGSVWLTAFVLKCFSVAQNMVWIDVHLIKEMQYWLTREINKSGIYFNSNASYRNVKVGTARNDAMNTLAVYVIIALLESGAGFPSLESFQEIRDTKNVEYLDNYVLALRAYASSLVQLPETEYILETLLNKAINDKDLVHWEINQDLGLDDALETASYIVLAMVTYNSSLYKGETRQIINWIIKEIDNKIDLPSDQATVMVLQALAVYSSHQCHEKTNMEVAVSYMEQKETFLIDESSKFLMQLLNLPRPPLNITFDVVGYGCVLIQAGLHYKTLEQDSGTSFATSIEPMVESNTVKAVRRIHICSTLPGRSDRQNVLEIKLLSGFTPYKDDLQQIVNHNNQSIERFEVNDRKVSFFIKDGSKRDLCVNFRLKQDIHNMDMESETVLKYDYSQPELSISKIYHNSPTPIASIYLR